MTADKIMQNIKKLIGDNAVNSKDKAATFGCKYNFIREYIKLQSEKEKLSNQLTKLQSELKNINSDVEKIDNILLIKEQLQNIIRQLGSSYKYSQNELSKLMRSSDENELLQPERLITSRKKQGLIKKFNGLLGIYRKNKFHQDDVEGRLDNLQEHEKNQQKKLSEECYNIQNAIEKIEQYEKEKNLTEEYDKATEYTRNTSSMYKELYFEGARLGIDYIIIPDGTWHHGPATVPGKIPENYSLDYAKLGYEKGKPCCNYNGGACTIFDGDDLILTCDYELYKRITSKDEYPHKGWVPFYNAGQEAFLNDFQLERQFETMIIQHKGNDCLILPQGKYPDLSDYDNYRVQQEMKNSPNFTRYSCIYETRKENPR